MPKLLWNFRFWLNGGELAVGTADKTFLHLHSAPYQFRPVQTFDSLEINTLEIELLDDLGAPIPCTCNWAEGRLQFSVMTFHFYCVSIIDCGTEESGVFLVRCLRRVGRHRHAVVLARKQELSCFQLRWSRGCKAIHIWWRDSRTLELAHHRNRAMDVGTPILLCLLVGIIWRVNDLLTSKLWPFLARLCLRSRFGFDIRGEGVSKFIVRGSQIFLYDEPFWVNQAGKLAKKRKYAFHVVNSSFSAFRLGELKLSWVLHVF